MKISNFTKQDIIGIFLIGAGVSVFVSTPFIPERLTDRWVSFSTLLVTAGAAVFGTDIGGRQLRTDSNVAVRKTEEVSYDHPSESTEPDTTTHSKTIETRISSVQVSDSPDQSDRLPEPDKSVGIRRVYGDDY